jgi:putative flippase GtrA
VGIKKKNLWMFLRAQISSFAATLVDFGTLLVCVEVFRIWYLTGTVLGAILGAVTNYTIGRYWSFKSTKDRVPEQAFRYFIVAAGSLVLNAAGVYVITEGLKAPYWVSKIVTSLLVGVVYNFFMQKRFVFRKFVL